MRAPLQLITTALALSTGLSIAKPPAPPLNYRVQASTPSQEGSFDYLSVEQPSGRVFIGRSFGVEVMEGGRMTTVLERKTVASVLQLGAGQLLTTNRGMDSATIIDSASNRVLADIPTGKSPDGAAYDARSGLAFVMNGGSKDITVIDIQARRAVGRIGLDATPEAGVVDGAGRLYVNLEETNEIAVIDIATRRVTGRYALAGCEEPTGLARDPASGILAAACRNGVLKFIDSRDGRDRGQLEIGKGADTSIFDAARRVGFVPCLDGTLTVYRLDEAGHVVSAQRQATRAGARTAAYDSARDRLYLAVADVELDAAGNYLRARQNFQVLTLRPDVSKH
ncbi:MAG TPA: YncE family protein [Roseateles sp.]|uniref:YncE family protein n=1 Tax=Roseateles sp. TaxID=1971397 RepID=UPI002ED77E4B